MIKKRFLFEIIVGITGLIATLVFNTKGIAILSLVALWPVISKKIGIKMPEKFSEKQLMLFYKTGNFSFAFFIVILLIIAKISPYIGINWLPLSVASLFLVHGWIGYIIFYRE